MDVKLFHCRVEHTGLDKQFTKRRRRGSDHPVRRFRRGETI